MLFAIHNSDSEMHSPTHPSSDSVSLSRRVRPFGHTASQLDRVTSRAVIDRCPPHQCTQPVPSSSVHALDGPSALLVCHATLVSDTHGPSRSTPVGYTAKRRDESLLSRPHYKPAPAHHSLSRWHQPRVSSSRCCCTYHSPHSNRRRPPKAAAAYIQIRSSSHQMCSEASDTGYSNNTTSVDSTCQNCVCDALDWFFGRLN